MPKLSSWWRVYRIIYCHCKVSPENVHVWWNFQYKPQVRYIWWPVWIDIEDHCYMKPMDAYHKSFVHKIGKIKEYKII